MKCSNCGYENPPGLKFCGMCGTLQGKPCPACAYINPFFFRYCGMCGKDLDEQALGSSPGPDSVPAAQASPAAVEIAQPALPAEKPSEVSLLEGERRIITVILADVFGSTNLLEHIGNEAWVDLMNRVLSSLEAEIYRFGGQVDQFRGDGLLAFFGAQTSSEDDPERAVLAGLSMQQKMETFAREFSSETIPPVKLRVGINTGEVIVAGIGAPTQHREDTAMGIAITIAARMESSAEPGTVLVSENTYRQISSQFAWEALGETTVKGISNPIAVYRPISSKLDAERLTDLEVFGYSATLIGRDEEFYQLKQKVLSLESGRGGMIFLSGEYGVGKNGLIRELRQFVLRNDALLEDAGVVAPLPLRQVLWLSCRAKTYYGNAPYAVWTELLNNWLGVCDGESREQIQERLWLEAVRMWGDRSAEYYPYLAKLLDLPVGPEYSERVKYLDGEALRLQFQAAIRAWLEELVKAQAVILVATGMEWADPSSVDLINACLPLIESAPVLWLFAYRQERSADIWNLRRICEISYSAYLLAIDLKPLSDTQTEELIQSLVGADTLPKKVRELLIKNSEGMPAYIIEIFRTLIQNEILVQDTATGGWRLARMVTTLDMPANLHRLLQARFDRLGDEERFVLQLAAVIGSVFWTRILQSILGEGETLRERLDVLIQAQLIERTGRVPDLGTQFAFRTNLIREAAYESLLSSQREWYHLKIATVLEEMADLQARYYQALIAYHYRNSGNLHKELFYTIWAAEKASEFYASAEAIEHYTRALELLEEIECCRTGLLELKSIQMQRFEVLTGRHLAYFRLGEVDAGTVDARSLMEIARSVTEEPTWMIDALLSQPEVTLVDRFDYIEPGERMVNEALGLAWSLGDRNRQLRGLEAKARLQFLRGDLAAFESAQQALGLARELGNADTETSLLLELAAGYGKDNLPMTKLYLDQAVEVNQRIQNKRLEIDILTALSAFVEGQGDYYRMLVEYENKSLEISHEIGDKLSEGFSIMYAAQVKGLYLGDYEVALEEMRKAFKITGKLASSLYPLLRIVQLQTMMGRYEEAERDLDQRAYALQEGEIFGLGKVAMCLISAILRNRRGSLADRQQAVALTDQARQLVHEGLVTRHYLISAYTEAAIAHLGLAEMESDAGVRQGHLELASAASEQAYQIYQEYGFVQISECVSEEVIFWRAKALQANGRDQEAGEYFRQAYAEMMRKYELIPPQSHYRQTYLENIALHREIQAVIESIASSKKKKRSVSSP